MLIKLIAVCKLVTILFISQSHLWSDTILVTYWFASLPMIWVLPVKKLIFHEFGEPGFVWEEQGEISGQDTMLDVAQDLLVLSRCQLPEDVVAFLQHIHNYHHL